MTWFDTLAEEAFGRTGFRCCTLEEFAHWYRGWLECHANQTMESAFCTDAVPSWCDEKQEQELCVRKMRSLIEQQVAS